ncbi:Ba223 [Baboon cytomegalovirus]|nr:Ba223 [Baboon cytomegalovirus]
MASSPMIQTSVVWSTCTWVVVTAMVILLHITGTVHGCRVEPGEDVIVEQECRQRNNLMVATGRLVPKSHQPHVIEFNYKIKDRLGFSQRIQLHISGLSLNNETTINQPVTWRVFARRNDLDPATTHKAKLRLISDRDVPSRQCEIIVGRDGGLEEPESWSFFHYVGQCIWWFAVSFFAVEFARIAWRWLGKIDRGRRSSTLLRAEMLHNNREMFWKRRRARFGGVSETPLPAVPPRYAFTAPWSPKAAEDMMMIAKPSSVDETAPSSSLTPSSLSPESPISSTPPSYSSVFPPFPE